MSTVLWVIIPYLSLATFVVGHFWRYRYDKFGWTTRSSQLYEDKMLRIGSPLFHFGMLGVVAGHVIGLVIPKLWTDALGISDGAYHVIALAGGIPAEVVAAIAAAVVSLEGAVAVRSIRKAPAGGSRRGGWGDAGVLANTTPFMA